ncbi:MAG TPA: hypothetical protein VL326_22275 [Kofleriaceae bacterium]|nr:hypothetical protein [Kofleriaceae bacterium]
MTQVDDVIEHYKSELLAEAELARDDLKEIEDHLRTLTEELCERGMPALEAVKSACGRLGEPRAVAREHARVRSPFGARLSRVRSISAAVLLLTLVIGGYYYVIPREGMWSVPGLRTILHTVMIIALLARLTWARPIVLGGVAFFTLCAIQAQYVDFGHGLVWLVPLVGATLFVMPWRRGELRRAGVALALQALAFGAASVVAGRFFAPGDGPPYHMAPAGLVAVFALVIAVSGTVLRARWAALASTVAAIALVVSAIECAPFFFMISVHFAMLEWLPMAGMLAVCAIAAGIAAYASWTSARSNVGTLQHVLR